MLPAGITKNGDLMGSKGLHLTFRDDPPCPDERFRRSWDGFSVECVRLPNPRTFEYTWKGGTNYLAVHDIRLADGEISIGDEVTANRTDLRDCLTFVPQGVQVSGWSELAGSDHGYTAVYFDPGLAEAEIERPLLGVAARPLLYFQHLHLSQTLRRVARLISAPEDHDPLAAESLGLLAVLQLYPLLGSSVEPSRGQLSLGQQRRIRDFVEAHLHLAVSLSNMAAVAEQSRFHFARSFSRTYGLPPHQYLLRHRIGLTATLLATTNIPVAEIATRVGFSSPARLSTAFRRTFGQSPQSFRQAVR